MEKEELLLAFSELMDKKLDVLRVGLEEKIDDTNQKVDNLNLKLGSVTTRLEDTFSFEISRLDKKIDDSVSKLDKKIDDSVSKLDKKIDDNTYRLETLIDTKTSKLEMEIRHSDILIENEVVPRLRTLEECYTSTYKRYKDGVLKIEGVVEDTDLLKQVVQKHSVRLSALEARA